MLPKKKNLPLPPPPPRNVGGLWLWLWAKPKNFSYYPPPLNLPGSRRSRKISATTPPHRIWSASGDHGKLAPPKKNPGYAVVTSILPRTELRSQTYILSNGSQQNRETWKTTGQGTSKGRINSSYARGNTFPDADNKPAKLLNWHSA